MKTILSVTLLLTSALTFTAVEAHESSEHQSCDASALVGVWRVNDTEGNSVLPGRQIALARTGETFESDGKEVTVFTVVGMGFRQLIETKGFGSCKTDADGHQMYVVSTSFSNKTGNYTAAMTPHTSAAGHVDEACANTDATVQKNCIDYFEPLQTRWLAITTKSTTLAIKDLQDYESLIPVTSGMLETEDVGNGHSHGGSGSD